MHKLSTAIALAEPQDISVEVLIEKYAKSGETSIDEVRSRVAKALAQVEDLKQRKKHAEQFLWAMQHGFIPAGRVNSAAGTDLQSTLINCFVQPVGDSITEIVDGKPGIYTALAEAAETMRRGGGVGYIFRDPAQGRAGQGHRQQRIRPDFLHEGVRPLVRDGGIGRRPPRRANGGGQRDPSDVLDFITVKQERGQLNNFNISVGVTDAFMQAVEADLPFELAHANEPNAELKRNGAYLRADHLWVYRTVQAREVWDLIMQSTYAAAEPGVLYMDRINAENNLSYCETIEATNPCGEQPLARLRLLLPGQPESDRLCEAPFTARGGVRFRADGARDQGRGAHARQRADRDQMAARRAGARSGRQAPPRPRLYRPGRCADHAGPALRLRARARAAATSHASCATPPMPVRSTWPRNAARSRCSMPTNICKADLHRVCRMR